MPTPVYPVWSIPDSLRAEISRVLGFPAELASASTIVGYPYYASTLALYQPYAILQDKLNALQLYPAEAVPIFGQLHPAFGTFFAPASATFTVLAPGALDVGTELSLAVAGATVTYTVAATDGPADVAPAIAAALNAAAIAGVLASAAGATVVVTSTLAGELGNGIALAVVSSDPTLLLGQPYALAPARAIATVLSGGANPPGPSFVPDGATLPVYGYVPTIRILEADLAGSRDNLDTAQAETFRPRSDEMDERARLLRRYRRELADRLAVPLDPDIAGNRSRNRYRSI